MTSLKAAFIDKKDVELFGDVLPMDRVAIGDEPSQSVSHEQVPFVRYSTINWLNGWSRLIDRNPIWRKLDQQRPELGLSRIWTIDCGGDGDCMFKTLAAGYNMWHGEAFLRQEDVRRLAAKQLTIGNIDSFLDCSMSSREFRPNDYLKIQPISKRVEQVQSIIQTNGNRYWGEVITLFLLLRHVPQFKKERLGFAVVTDFEGLSHNNNNKTFRSALRSTFSKFAPGSVSDTKHSSSDSAGIRVDVYATKETENLLYLYATGHPVKNHWILLGIVPTLYPPAYGPIFCVYPTWSMPKALKTFLM
jgi:hypothetical protein